MQKTTTCIGLQADCKYSPQTYNINIKSSFSEKKTSAGKSETHFSREAIENQCGKALRQNSITGRSGSSAKLFIMQNYTDNANGDLLLTVEKV